MASSTEIATFVERITTAMGLTLTTEVEELPDGVRVNVVGDDASVLLRRQGEVLAALQHIVAAVHRSEGPEKRRIVVDCMGFRKGKDAELEQMARFLAEKAVSTGLSQEIGPLNPYERRIVHLAVAEIESVASESIGDAFEKTVIISTR